MRLALRCSYDGLILPDAIGMKGFQKYGSPSEMAVQAVAAGCDEICLACDDESECVRVRHEVPDLLRKALAAGTLPLERLDDAVRRQLLFMQWLGILDDPFVDPDSTDMVFADADDAAFLADLDARAAVSRFQ